MPLKAINYDKTHFYKIVCKDTSITDCYVGHTTDFTTRKYNHRQNCVNIKSKSYNLKVYKYIRETGGWENWEMILIKTEKCENVLEARSKERECKEQLNATLNNNTPTRTLREHYKDNREKLLENKKEYHLQNIERIHEYQKDYREKNKEQLREKKKQYNLENRDEINKKKKQERIDNPEKFKERDKQAYQKKKIIRQRPYECECGCVCKFSSRLAHFKTAKHQQYLQSQTNPQE